MGVNIEGSPEQASIYYGEPRASLRYSDFNNVFVLDLPVCCRLDLITPPRLAWFLMVFQASEF